MREHDRSTERWVGFASLRQRRLEQPFKDAHGPG